MQNDDELVGIEEEFRASWDWTESFFHNLVERGFDFLLPMEKFIHDLREENYDEWFRAGQSMYSFIISRSKQHGLQQGQVCMRFDPNREGGCEVVAFIKDTKYQFILNPIAVTSEVTALLELLMEQPID